MQRSLADTGVHGRANLPLAREHHDRQDNFYRWRSAHAAIRRNAPHEGIAWLMSWRSILNAAALGFGPFAAQA